MGRVIKPRKSNPSVVVIVDGKDEKWYLERVREHYRPDVLRKVRIVPELAQKKKVAELFAEAEAKIKNGFTTVVLIVDFDDIGKDDKELAAFKNLFNVYLTVKSDNAVTPKKFSWMGSLKLIVNSPCIEFWYLLHFRKTSKYYPNYDQMKKSLKSIPSLSDYDKNESFYNRYPDIYLRLGGDEGLKMARSNAWPFDLAQCKNMGFSEMFKLFDFFDRVKV